MAAKRPYPDRPKCWANHVQKALINAEAIPVLGRDACWLIAYVAAREDMLFYKHVPKWWTPQLMDDAGFTNKKHFLKTRQTAIDAGWLIVNGGGKGVEGEYFTDIPVQFVGANSHQQTHQQDISRCESAPANVPLSEPTNAPLPNPYSPIPQEAEGAALSSSSATKKSKKPKAQRAAYPNHFEAVWNAYPATRRKNKVPTFDAYQAAVKRVAEADAGDIPKAAAWILERVTAFAGSYAGEKFAPESERWFRNDRFHDSPESWEKFGDRATVATSNPEAERAWQAVLDSLKRHSRFKPEQIMADVGERAWQALKSIGLKRIDESNEFERRELKAKFIQAFNREGVAA